MISTRAASPAVTREAETGSRDAMPRYRPAENAICVNPEPCLAPDLKRSPFHLAHTKTTNDAARVCRARDVKAATELLQHNVVAPFDCRETGDVIDPSRRPTRFIQCDALPSNYRRQTTCSSYARVQGKLSSFSFDRARRFV